MSTVVDHDSAASAAEPEPRPGPEPDETVPPHTAPRPTLPDGETGRLGEEIYERDIAPQLEPAHIGEYVAIDVDSRNWELADDLLAASAKLRAAHPEAANIWLIWVGYDAVAGFGARPSRRVR